MNFRKRCLTVLLAVVTLTGFCPDELAAWQDKQIPAQDDPRMEGIHELFDTLTEIAIGDRDPNEEPLNPLDRFDADRFITLIEDHIEFDDEHLREQFVQSFRDRADELAETWGAFMLWDDYQIREAEFQDDGTAVVVARHWNDMMESYSHFRWWLSETDGEWKFHDYEELDQGIRASRLVGLLINPANHRKPWMADFIALVTAMNESGSVEELMYGLPEYSERIDRMLDHDLPDDVLGMMLFFKATALLQAEDNYEENALDVLDLMDELEALDADCTSVHVLRGDALAVLEEYEKAVKSYSAYADRFGWDASICEVVADTWYWNDRSDKAVEFAERGLEDNHNAWGCLATLAVALPEDEKDRLEPHFAKLENDESALGYVGDWAIELEDMDAARQIYDMLRQHHPHSELVPWYQEILDQ